MPSIEIPWNELNTTDEGTVLYVTTSAPHAENVVVEGFCGGDNHAIELTNVPIPHGEFRTAVAVLFAATEDELRRFEYDTRRGFRGYRVPLGTIRRRAHLRAVPPADMPTLRAAHEVAAAMFGEEDDASADARPAKPSPPAAADGLEDVIRWQQQHRYPGGVAVYIAVGSDAAHEIIDGGLRNIQSKRARGKAVVIVKSFPVRLGRGEHGWLRIFLPWLPPALDPYQNHDIAEHYLEWHIPAAVLNAAQVGIAFIAGDAKLPKVEDGDDFCARLIDEGVFSP
jgi:hypothetical protein